MTPVALFAAANPAGIWPEDEAALSLFGRVPLYCDGFAVGCLDAAHIPLVQALDADLKVQGARVELHAGSFAARSERFAALARALAERGLLTGWRDERFEVSAATAPGALFEIERAAVRLFGMLSHAVHLNAVTAGELWVSRRATTKTIDPGLWDNLVAGGVAAGMTLAAALEKEAFEEAGLGPADVRAARCGATLGLLRRCPEGLQREVLHVFDLELPGSIVPANRDGEVDEIRRIAADEARVWLAAERFALDAALVVARQLGLDPGPDSGLVRGPHSVQGSGGASR